MQTQMRSLGDFQIEAGKVVVSDPCYEMDTICKAIIDNAKCGTWLAEIEIVKEFGERVSKLMCYHESVFRGERIGWEVMSTDIGVDSGQAGVFDFDHFKDDSDADGYVRQSKEVICENEPWYSMCCDKTISKMMAGTIPFGVVSSSGLGDGQYVCEACRRDGEIVAIRITFLGEEGDEEEDEEN